MVLRIDLREQAFAPIAPVFPPELPAEISFLTRHGISLAHLQLAAARAAQIGVDPAREVIASGLVSESTFYRALATELGLPFREDELALEAGGDPVAMMMRGAAPLAVTDDAPRLAIAPTGATLRRMIDAGPRGRGASVVTTPTCLAAATRRAHGRALARILAGSGGTGRERPRARLGPSDGQLAIAGGCIAAASFFGTLAPLETLLLLMLLSGPLFLVVVYLRLAAMFESLPLDLGRSFSRRVDDRRLPVYTVAVPIVREMDVLDKLLEALAALDYPRAKLDIRLLVEEYDHELRQALATRQLPPNFEVLIVPCGEPRTKPRALNLALLEARGELFTIYDAEDVPDPLQLRLAAARFLRAPRTLACLQARLVIDNGADGPLQALFALEYAGLFDVLNPGLLRLPMPILLGGTSNHFRTAALRDVGGWDSWNVTEDADIGLRLLRAGYRMDDLSSTTLEEAPRDLRCWLKQRIRWNKGYIQTLISHLRDPVALLREAGWMQSFGFLALALGGLVSALSYPVFAAAFIMAALDDSLLAVGKPFGDAATLIALTLAFAGSFALMVAPMLGALRRRAYGLLKWLPLLPLYYLAVSAAAWLALVEYAHAPFRWNKTKHGMARTSRYSA